MKSTWNIPDQCRITDPDELEKMLKDKSVKPCPNCGARIYIGMTGGYPNPSWDGTRCMACNYTTIIEI